MQWDAPSPVVHLSFTASESLVILTASGQYRLYSLSAHPHLPPDYSLHAIPNLQDTGVKVREAKPYPGGFVALLDDGSFVEVRIPPPRGTLGAAASRANGDDQDAATANRATATHRTVALAPTGLDPAAGTPVVDCWCVLPPDPTSTRTLEVLFAKGETVYRLDEVDCVDQVRVPPATPSAQSVR